MSTTIRSELSQKNKYWLEKHRYYELKHFCLQYPIWKKAYLALDSLPTKSMTEDIVKCFAQTSIIEKCVESRDYYFQRMDMLKRTALEADSVLQYYILKGVTEGLSYDILKVRFDIPCCRDTYYELYRRFFWLLNRTRN